MDELYGKSFEELEKNMKLRKDKNNLNEEDTEELLDWLFGITKPSNQEIKDWN